MLGSGSFFFFFHLLNNWPSSMVYLWDSTISPGAVSVDIEISVPADERGLIPLNSLPDFHSSYGITVFSVCTQLNHTATANYTFVWELSREGRVERRIPTTRCDVTMKLLFQDTYTCSVSVRDENGTLRAEGRREWKKEGRWIAVLGDSFSSGDGNPDENRTERRPAKWMDESCHRSRHSFAYQWALSQSAPSHPLYLSFLSCTGSTIERGILGGSNSQVEMLERLSAARGSGPDAILITVGGNDVGFAEVLQYLRTPKVPLRSFDMRFLFLSSQLDRVAARLGVLGAGVVILPLYYDMTRDETGYVNANCKAFRPVSTSRLVTAEKLVFQRLNRLLTKKGAEFGWKVETSVPEIFSHRGVCSSSTLIRSPSESLRMLGSSSGAFHPNIGGHRLLARRLADNFTI